MAGTVRASDDVVPVLVMVGGVKTPVTPAGAFSSVSATSPVKLPIRTIVIVVLTTVPAVADSVGATSNEIPGSGATVSEIVVVRSV